MSKKKVGPGKTLKDLKNEQAIIELVTYLGNTMPEYNVTKDELKGILEWAAKEYNIPDNTKVDLGKLIENQKNAIDNIKI